MWSPYLKASGCRSAVNDTRSGGPGGRARERPIAGSHSSLAFFLFGLRWISDSTTSRGIMRSERQNSRFPRARSLVICTKVPYIRFLFQAGLQGGLLVTSGARWPRVARGDRYYGGGGRSGAERTRLFARRTPSGTARRSIVGRPRDGFISPGRGRAAARGTRARPFPSGRAERIQNT